MTNGTKGLSRRDVLKGTGAAGIIATAGCVDLGGSGDSGPYQIGMVDSQTGSLSAFGERNQRGRELALSAVNDVGIGGRELSISVQDSQSQQQTGVSAAQQLVNQQEVPFLIGAVGSGVSLAIYQSVVQSTDVVQLSQNSTSPQLTDYPGLLRMSPTGRTQSTALADIITEDGGESVAITWINNDYGSGIKDAFVDAYDGEVVYNSSHDQGQSSYSNVVSQMANTDADSWLFITYQPEFTTMTQEAYSSGVNEQATWYGADSVQGSDVLANTPDGSLDGMKVVVPSAALDQENYQSFASEFESEYDRSPTAWAAYAYDCVVTAALTIQAADDFTGSALGDVVRDVTRPEGETVTSFEAASEILSDGGSATDVDYQGVSGPIDFDENGDPVAYLQVLTVQDHEYESTDFVTGE
ncbi:ABC transporter substrate-binding protein [Halobacterium jilantaiense]|uniref:Branched-chain amino acid transport system substrate-binding protein n=1 Tax=Halobacterium jilantaiense TaxID=355548 RepID=A0A1I0P4W5_9EURY|nr:ABC transporter substrate-binding protein [Halobacterium jilantaiense]SEW09096.1 branched-chain amino acid transport system substrate-binding protein [Halobacterium jilantaiense]